MKHILITDTHVDLKGGIDWHQKQHKRLYDIVFGFMEQHSINSIIHLGDFFDSRKSPSTKSLKFVNDEFINPLLDKQYNLTIITGNHDVYWKNTNSVNSLDLCLPKHPNIEIIDKPKLKYNTLMFPWVNSENHDDVMDVLKSSTDVQMSMGHWEFSGFTMSKNGIPQNKGLNPSILSNIPRNLSGHFHGESKQVFDWGYVHYLGSTLQQDKHDLDDPKAFFVYDDETFEVVRVQHNIETFKKIILSYPDQEPEKCTDCFVFLDVMQGIKQSDIDKFKLKLYNFKPYSVIVDNNYNVVEMKDGRDGADLEKPQDMLELMSEFIDNVKIEHSDIDKDKLKDKMINLYNRVGT